MPAKTKSSGLLYVQIAQELKQEIARGIYPVGAQLPTEDELCSRFSVSRYTVREALRQLRDEGLVSSRQGAGTMVVPPSESQTYAFGALSIEDLLHFASGSSISVQSTKMVTIDKKLSKRTGLPIGEERLAVCALGFKKGSEAPLGWAEYFIHQEFAAVGRLLKRHTIPIFPLIEDLFCVKIIEVQQEISATLISTELAERLSVEPESPALQVLHTYRIADGRIAQVTLNTHPAERYHHSVTMKRLKT